jgi:hypothetical protein
MAGRAHQPSASPAPHILSQRTSAEQSPRRGQQRSVPASPRLGSSGAGPEPRRRILGGALQLKYSQAAGAWGWLSHCEVNSLGVMNYDGGRRLLRYQLIASSQLDPDAALDWQQCE